MAAVNIGTTVVPVMSNGQAALLGQNSGDYPVYISDQPTLVADGTSLVLAPGTPFTWPSNVPLFAVCSPGTTSRLTYTATGATMGTSNLALLNPAVQYLPAPNPNTVYISTYNHPAGIYTITCPATTIATVSFYNAGGLIITAVTVNGSIIVSVPTTATYITYYTLWTLFQAVSGFAFQSSQVKSSQQI